ncbi:outer membrane beta-barrel protein [Ferrimonas balearica]|uniref:outer membrane beta-barrel protein n=1 Tax=Ferrimonas balearica TaxID=44012 RepID=UPI001C996C5E|nr:outer membrane beta-barrel protein [Ferrimonas balearica]MBY5990976.1 porin family protein [Ferrimonas balearica]
MKKTTTALLLSSLLAAPAMANNIDYFVGFGLGYQEDTIKGDVRKDSDDLSYEARVGAIFNDNHRLMGTYSYKEDKFDRDDSRYKHEQHLFLASYDYLMPLTADGRLQAFAGLSMGGVGNKLQGKNSNDFTWGGQAGMQYRLTNNWSAELRYQYLDMDYDKQGLTVEDSQNVTFAIDYRF